MYGSSNNSKKNKEMALNSSNDMLSRRDTQSMEYSGGNFGTSAHGTNVDRLFMERNGFDINTREQKKMSTYKTNKKKHSDTRDRYVETTKRNKQKHHEDTDGYGEITGTNIDESNAFDHGMPMRSSYHTKKEVFDQNAYLDFNLFDKKKQTQTKIQYNDPSGGGYCSISKSTDIISKKSDPHRICMDGVTSLNIFLHNNVGKMTNTSYNINGLGLYLTFATLFNGSNRNSEIEIQNYFNFPEKNIVQSELSNFISHNAKSLFPCFSFRSYVLNDRFVPLSKQFAQFSRMVPFITVDNSHPHEESKRLNSIFMNDTNSPNIISSNTIKRVNISVVNILRFNPIWGVSVDSITLGKFMGMKTPFLRFAGQSFGCYEDSEKIIVEIPIKGMKLLYGVILYKKNRLSIDQSDLEMCIGNMKEMVIDEVLIPKIVKRTKIRLNNTLKNTDLKVIFMDTDLPSIYPEKGGNLGDVIQYCDILIDENCVKSRNTKRGYQSMRSIIVDKSFSYYVRYAPENVILSMGYID